MRPRLLIPSMMLGIAAALSACTLDSSRTTSPQAVGSSLDEQVRQAVHSVPGVDAQNLNVMTRDGVVTLSGRTATRDQAQEAIEAARHVPGVQKVDYDIQVDEP